MWVWVFVFYFLAFFFPQKRWVFVIYFFMHLFLCFGKDSEELVAFFLWQDPRSSFSVKGKPMVINAIRFLLIVFFLAALP